MCSENPWGKTQKYNKLENQEKHTKNIKNTKSYNKLQNTTISESHKLQIVGSRTRTMRGPLVGATPVRLSLGLPKVRKQKKSKTWGKTIQM